jgi:hypothetical protein
VRRVGQRQALRTSCLGTNSEHLVNLPGQRFVTCTTMLVPAFDNLCPLLSVSAVNFQHAPHPEPAPAPGPTPNSFCDTAAEYPGEV